MIRVTVWNEFYHEKNDPRTAAVYPDGLHMAIKRMLECEDVTVRTATLDDPECGLTEEVLADTDVLVWWGHVRHHLVPDEVAKRVQMHVLSGMGLIVLHSGHKSKPFMRLMGTTCSCPSTSRVAVFGERFMSFFSASVVFPLLRASSILPTVISVRIMAADSK